ncbi:MAG TPA: hypothetical protein VJ063_06355 [Verrucomicrobiae bacterium]|nr:hypothetical protein [Verrucomicrobiae bacterium]
MHQPLRMAFGFAMLFSLCGYSGRSAVQLTVQRGYIAGIPTLVRVDSDKSVWDGTATLTASPGVSISPNQVVLRNGCGSAFVTISGAIDFNLTATIGTTSATRSIRAVTNDPVSTIGGTLPGSATTWSGIVRVTNDVTVPAGHTLTILSNTLVMVDGVASGTTAADILVAGTVQSLGTADYPVTITCSSANLGLSWGQIRHNTAQPSVYRYTSINRAGRAGGEGHTGTGPAFRPTNSRILFDHCNITDLGSIGKIMMGSGADLTFADCLMSRARMGPELQNMGLFVTNTYFLEFRGPDDSDALYVHAQGAGQQVNIVDSVIGYTDDDGLDTLDAAIDVERCIFRNMDSGVDPDGKGVSIFNRVVNFKRCIVADCITSVSAKWNGGPATFVTMNECTILGRSNSVVAAYKDNAPGPNIDYRITNSILRSFDPVRTDFGPTNFTIVYCNVSEDWPGAGNQTALPQFVGTHDYRLQSSSPCIDAGIGTDPDGSTKDIGAFTFIAPAAVLTAPGLNQFVLNAFPNRNYVVDFSTNLSRWDVLGTFFQTNSANLIQDSGNPLLQKFYRARLAP